MANKTFNTRVKNKRDTAANWEAVATTFQPLDGELIIVDTSAGKTRFKVGRYDTAKGRLLYYNEIPFADEYLYNDLNESQGKIYDKLKGIDDKSIIESTLEPSTGTAAVKNYNIGIWQFPKTGFYKIKLSQLGTNITFLRLYARKTKDDGTLPEDDFSNDNLVMTSGAGGDGQLEYIYILADYLDIDSLTAYKIQFLNPILKQGITWVNTYDKTTQKWSFASAANVNAKNVSSNLTLTKGDTKTVYDGSVAREISIPTKTSELTNDSNFTTQTDLDNLTNTVVSYNAQENITDEQKAQARNNIGAISSSEVSSNYLSLDDTQELTEIQQDALKNKLYYINNLKVLSNWVEATEQCKKESGHVLVIQNDAHNDGDTVPDVEDSYPILLIPARIRGTNQNFYAIDAYGNNYMCSFSYSSFKFMVTKNAMYQQTMKADPTEDMQIATKKYVDSSVTQPDWNQNDTTAKDYIKNRICYTEESITELGNNYEIWKELVNEGSTTEIIDVPLSIKYDGIVYKNIKPRYMDQHYYYDLDSSVGSMIIVPYTGTGSTGTITAYPEKEWSFVQVNDPIIHQIPSEYINTTDIINTTMNKAVVPFVVQNFVAYSAPQTLTDEQKAQARNNIGAVSSDELVQSDWNQNDTTAKDYVKNRICYEETGEDKTYTLTPNNDNNTWNFTNGDIPLILGQSATVKSFGGASSTFTGTVTQDSDGKLCIDATSVIPITIYSNTATYLSQWINNAAIVRVTVTISSIVVHQIDPKYIPDTNKQTLTNGNITLTCDANIVHDNQAFKIINVNNEESQLTLNEKSIVLFTIPNSTGPGSSDIIFNTGEISSVYTKVLQDSQYSLTDTSFNINAHSDLNITSDSNTNIQAGSNKVITIGENASTSNEVNLLASNINIQGNKLAISSGSTNDVTATLNGKEIATKEYVDDKTVVDDALSDTSTNPVQNKVVKAAIDSKPSAADAVYTATAESTDGVAYTATVSGIDSLTVGASFIMIPNKASTSKAPTLNVNGLGAKPIRRRLSSLTTSLQQGYSTNWIALNKPFTVVYDGTAWVIEGLTKTDGADVYGAVAQATADAKGNNIADTYATIAMLQSLLPKVTTITLTSNWVGDASPYYQDIALSCVTETSIVDLQPTPEQLNSWQDDGLAFTTLSGNGTVRVYVAGGKPSSAISVQVRVQEVTVI